MVLKKMALLYPRLIWHVEAMIVIDVHVVILHLLVVTRLLSVVAALIVALTVVVEVVTATVIVMMIAVHGVVMSAEMMIAVVIGVITVVIDALMMVTATIVMMVTATIAMMMEVDVVQTVHLHGMLIPIVRSAKSMDILLVNAGGVILMTRKREMMEKRMHSLHHMVLTQTSILIQVPPTTLPVN
jgi:hypothetical protein